VSGTDARAAITQAHQGEWARVVASLAKHFGDLDIAEEAAAEAFAIAVERWPADGVPPNPGAWLNTTANRKAIDRILWLSVDLGCRLIRPAIPSGRSW
jgi:RNA polymerase sigma-70 factor, ECF subfamily